MNEKEAEWLKKTELPESLNNLTEMKAEEKVKKTTDGKFIYDFKKYVREDEEVRIDGPNTVKEDGLNTAEDDGSNTPEDDGTNTAEDNGSNVAEDDIWDDTALVQAYDRAVSAAKEKITRRMGLNASGNESKSSNKMKSSKRKNKKQIMKWNVGDPCCAVYSEDGVTYEATVNSVSRDKGTCVITYVGYNNVEEVSLKILKPSQGPSVRKAQEQAAAEDEQNLEMELDEDSVNEAASIQHDKMDWKTNSAKPPEPRVLPHNFRSFRMPSMAVPPMVLPPPPPPHLINTFPEEDTEALSAMLMSWYMSGFHTGYYQGLKQAKNVASSGGNSSRNSSRKK